MKFRNKFNVIFFLVWPFVAVFLSFRFSINAFYSPIIFYGIPAILLSIQKPKNIYKALAVSLLSIPAIVIIDYIAELTGIWAWPLPQSLFPRLFNLVSLEVILWVYLHFYFVIIFYEYFFEKKKEHIWHPRSKKIVSFTLILFAIFIITLVIYPHILRIPYWYFIFGILFILPPVVMEEINFPRTFLKLIKTAIYFFYLNFAYEITALKIGWWSFPSKQFVGNVTFFGVTFPFEEFFFWIILFTLAMLSYYEYFFDDEK